MRTLNEKLIKLNKSYDKLQRIYGDSSLHSIYNGGCSNNPDLCFVFMNPTSKNISSQSSWNGPHYPWLGTKNIWNLFYKLNLLDQDIYFKIKEYKHKEWTEEFSNQVYESITNHKCFITNLGKCTQKDARPLPNYVYQEYLELLFKEITIIDPKVIILFGNQVSSLVLNQKISVSNSRKKLYLKKIKNKEYKFYSVYYPVGNGIFNIDKSIEDINWIIEHELKRESRC